MLELFRSELWAVPDPGFRREHQLQRWVWTVNIEQIFPQKPHDNERNWTEGRLSLGSANERRHTCASFCSQGGRVLHPGGSASKGGGLHLVGGLCFCFQGGLHPVGLGRSPIVYHGIRYTSGRYASYWNASLLFVTLLQVHHRENAQVFKQSGPSHRSRRHITGSSDGGARRLLPACGQLHVTKATR